MDTADVLAEVNRVFPYVEKQTGIDISFHKFDCGHCQYLREDLEEFVGIKLPSKALRTVYGEMSSLSADGWNWILPSYLRHCLSVENNYDDLETEFLIYNLGPDEKYIEETLLRLAVFNIEQVDCIVHFLEWCGCHKHWSEYCPENIEKALAFMRTVRSDLQFDPDASRRST